MKLTINPSEVTKNIKKVERAIPSKALFPILDMFMITIDGDKSSVLASDNEVQLTLPFPIISSDETFAFCVDAKKFSAIINSIKSNSATLIVDLIKNELICKHDKGKLTMPCMAANDFPIFNLTSECKSAFVKSNELINAINGVIYACSNDDLRPALKGVYFDFIDDGFTTVATDTHKLVRIKSTSNVDAIDSFIMPQKASQLILSSVELSDNEILIKNDGNMCEVVFGSNYSLIFRQINGKYPNYNAVFPSETNKEAVINKNELQESLRRTLLMTSQINAVVFKFASNELHLSSRDLDFNTSAEEVLNCKYSGEPMEIMFNGNDFSNMINSMPTINGEFSMYMTEKAKPIIAKPSWDSNVSALLMPLYML